MSHGLIHWRNVLDKGEKQQGQVQLGVCRGLEVHGRNPSHRRLVRLEDWLEGSTGGLGDQDCTNLLTPLEEPGGSEGPLGP